MEYMGDAQWWNNRFMNRSLDLMSHEKKLEDDLDRFKSHGKVLDVACGDGRNSIFLARKGYFIEAIDFSEEALQRLHHFAAAENLHIKTSLRDLTAENAFSNLDEYDAIMINHYRLKGSSYCILESHLKPDGILWVNGFRQVPVDNPNITDRDLILDEDFRDLANCKLVQKEQYENGTYQVVRYIFGKQQY